MHSRSRLDGIDLLRGLAILFVLLNHVNMRLLFAHVPYLASLPRQLASSLAWNAQRGVQIFFAVSGFLITSISLRRWGTLSDISVRGFYRLRFARIAPLLLLLLAILSTLHLAGVNHYVVSAKTGGLPRALLAALTFHVNLLEARRGYLPGNWDVLWSLSVEETFYFGFPIVCRLFRRTRFLVPLFMVFVVLGPFARTVFAHGNDTWQEYSYLGSMDAIALGCLTALLVAHRTFPPRTLGILGTIGAVTIVICLGATRYLSAFERSGLDMTVLALGACFFILFAAQTEWKAPRLLRPLLQLGERSYEIYLAHMFVVFAAFDFFVARGKPMRGVPVLFAAVILVSFVLGELIARFYSEPLNRWLRRPRDNNEASTDERGALETAISRPSS